MSEIPAYNIGLVLSGGGARCIAHLGALKALEQNGLKPDIIAGTNAGAVVGAFYAAGIDPEAVLNLFRGRSSRHFASATLRGPGFFSLRKLKKFIQDVLGPGCSSFADLEIPLLVGATALDHIRFDMLDSGPLADALVASCSMPVLTAPYTFAGNRYIDGCLMHSLPSEALRPRCRYLVGVNCSVLDDTNEPRNSLFYVGMQTYTLIVDLQQAADIGLCDLGVQVHGVKNHRMFSFTDLDTLFEEGYSSTLKALEQKKHGD